MPGDDVVVNGQDVTRLRQVEIQLAAANARLEEQNEVLRMQASTDLLTGLSNRRALLSDAKQHWNRALRLDEEFSVILLDIDNFKRVNDQRGHLVGDEVLERIGRILWDAKRSYDEAGRWGGEEFMLVLPAAGIDQAHAAAERIRQAICQERFMDRDEQAFSVTASLGVASRDAATTVPSGIATFALSIRCTSFRTRPSSDSSGQSVQFRATFSSAFAKFGGDDTFSSNRLASVCRAVKWSDSLASAVRSSQDLPSGTPEISSCPPPSGLSAKTSASCLYLTLSIMLPPSLRRRYPASSLLLGNPTSPRASVASRFLLCLLPAVNPNARAGPAKGGWTRGDLRG